MTFNDSDRYIIGIFFLPLGIITLWIFLGIITDNNWSISKIFYSICVLIIGCYCIIVALDKILVIHSIIINKKAQNMIFKSDSPIHKLKSDEKISFSEIKEIEIAYYLDFDEDDLDNNLNNWDISLITTRGESKFIFTTQSCKEAKKIAEGILKITDKEVLFEDCSDFLSVEYCKKFVECSHNL